MDKQRKIGKLRKELKAAHTPGARSLKEQYTRRKLRALKSYVFPKSRRENIRQGRLRAPAEENARRGRPGRPISEATKKKMSEARRKAAAARKAKKKGAVK